MSEQATAAAENIASWLRLEAHQFPSDGNVAEWAAIIDAAFAPVVAELVALLRMGKELAEAARDSTQGTPQKRYRAASEANAILERYDAAIAKNGGA